MNIWGRMLRGLGWEVRITAPRRDKCVICVAPHTSNWDFILGLSSYMSLGRKANFLMKDFWFFFPLKYLLKDLGGIPVPRSGKHSSLTDSIINMFKSRDYINLAVTPEGTRSATSKWRTGFLYIALGAGVPIQLGVIDYAHRKIIIKDEFQPTGNVEADLQKVKDYYAPYKKCAREPEKFEV